MNLSPTYRGEKDEIILAHTVDMLSAMIIKIIRSEFKTVITMLTSYCSFTEIQIGRFFLISDHISVVQNI